MWLTYHWQDSESCETELKRSDEILSAGLIVTDGCEHDGRGRVSRIELITVSLNVTSHNGHTHPPVLSIESLRLSSQHNSKLIANMIANSKHNSKYLTDSKLSDLTTPHHGIVTKLSFSLIETFSHEYDITDCPGELRRPCNV